MKKSREKSIANPIVEVSLMESNLQTQKITQAALDGFWIVDMKGRIMDVNQAYCQLTGYTRNELLGMTVLDVEAIETEADFSRRMSYVIKKGSDRFESKHRCKNGNSIDLEISINYLPNDSRIFAFLRDITEKKRSVYHLSKGESRFRRLFDSNILGIAFWDDQGNVNDANDAYLKIIGYTRKELESGIVNWAKMTPPEYAELDRKGMIEIKKNGFCTPFEKEYIRKDGSRVAVLIGGALFEGTGNGGVAYVIDISKRIEAEQALLEKTKALTKLNEYSIDLSRLQDEDNFEAFIATRIKQIAGAKVGVFSEYSSSNHTITTRHIELETQLYNKVVSILGEKMDRTKSIVSDDIYKEITTELIGKRKTLYEASFGAISKSASITVQKLLKIDRFIGLAYLIEDKLYGTSLIGMSKDQPDPPKEILENFILITSVFLRRRQAEKKLKRSQTLLNKAQSVSRVGSWVWYIQENRLEWSDEMYHIFGIEKENFSGLLTDVIESVIHPDDRHAVEKSNLAVIEDKNPIPVEYRIVWPDGSIRTVWAEAGELILNSGGDPFILIGIVQDITERKLAERALLASKEQFSAIAESSLVGIYVLQDGRYVYVNPAMAHFFGYSVTEMTGMSPSEIVQPSELKMVGENIRRRISGEVKTLHYEVIGRHKDGSSLNVEVYGSRIDINGSPALVGTLIDITERKQAEKILKQSEEKFRLSFMTGMDAFYWATLEEGLIIEINEVFETVFGYTRDEVIGKTSLELDLFFNPSDRAKMVAELKTKGFVKDLELAGRKKDGKLITISLSCRPTVVNNQEHILGVIRDITDQKRVEEKLKDTNAKLTHAQHIAHVGSWSNYLPSNQLVWSEEMYHILGFPLNIPINLEAVTHIFSQEELLRFQKAIGESISADVPYSMDYKIIRPDGFVRYIHDEGEVVRDKNGKAIWMHGTTQDITESKLAVEKMRSISLYARSLIEASIDPLVTINAEGKITDVNLSTEQITGIEREKLIGTDFADYFVNPLKAKKGYQIVFSEGVVRDYPLTIRHKNGHKVEVLYNASLFKDETGKIQGIFAAARDITDQKKMEAELKNSNVKLERLNERLNEIRESERELISREIHDQLGQTLSSLKIDLNWLSEQITRDSDEGIKLSKIIELVTSTIKDVQRISLELRPAILHDIGLAAALEWYLEEFSNRTGVIIKMDLEDIQSEQMSKNLTIYRVAQESLTNISRHAHANNVKIKLCKNKNDMVLTIEDDGIGITHDMIQSSRSLGILGMFERAKQSNGYLKITAPVSGGTKIKISIPM